MGLKKDIGFKGYEDQLKQSNEPELDESNNKKSKIIIASILGVIAIIVIIIITLMIIPMVSDSTSDSSDNATQATSNSESYDYDFDYLFGTSDDDEETTSNDENSDSESSQVPRMTIVPNSHSSSSSIPESNNNNQNSKSDSGSNSNNNNQSHSVTNNNSNKNSNNNSGSNNYNYNNNNNNNNNHNSSSSYHKPESSKKEESSKNTEIPVNNVSLNYTSTTLYEGESINLVASVSPSNATNKTVYWSSSNSDVASVDGGYVTAHSSGTTYITARAGNYYVNCMVTVKERDNIKLSPDRKTISKNQVITINVVGSNQKASWKISNPSIVQICGGSETSLMIKGKNTGTTYIEATVNGKTYKAEITVN